MHRYILRYTKPAGIICYGQCSLSINPTDTEQMPPLRQQTTYLTIRLIISINQPSFAYTA